MPFKGSCDFGRERLPWTSSSLWWVLGGNRPLRKERSVFSLMQRRLIWFGVVGRGSLLRRGDGLPLLRAN